MLKRIHEYFSENIRLRLFYRCFKKTSGKIIVSALIAIISFYSISFIERSFQISVIPKEETKFNYSKMEEAFEIKFFIYNKGWTDRTLTKIEVINKSDIKESKVLLDKILEKIKKTENNSKDVQLKVKLDGPSSFLIDLKYQGFPLSLPKQQYTEVILDKFSSYRIMHSEGPIKLYFDRDSIEITKEKLGYSEMSYMSEINKVNYKGNTEIIESSLQSLTYIDKLLKIDKRECPNDIQKLVLLKDAQLKKVLSLKLFNKTKRYSKLKDIMALSASSALIFFDFHSKIKDGPILITSNEYESTVPLLTRLYLIEKLIERRLCAYQLPLYDKLYSHNLGLYLDEVTMSVKENGDINVSHW